MKKINVCIMGGKLQGVEALYLAAKAGMETTLIDKSNSPLGKKFCGRFICRDVLQYNSNLIDILVEADMVLPALENREVLDVLEALAKEYDIHLVYDAKAYAVTGSKQLSDAYMLERGLPVPLHYPGGSFPYIVKPSGMSGSKGVKKIHSKDQLEAFFQEHDKEEWLAEEYLCGPSYSLEVIGTPGHYSTYHVTELLMDPEYDCKRVLSCPQFPMELKAQMVEETVALAEMVQLHGIMDVEVIEDKGTLKILEIDARIPSQTPITVYHATGWNFMTELVAKFGRGSVEKSRLYQRERYVSLEQLQVTADTVSVLGEHIIASADILSHEYDFFGADEAITDFCKDKTNWVATMILIADSSEELNRKRDKMLKQVASYGGKTRRILDDFPGNL